MTHPDILESERTGVPDPDEPDEERENKRINKLDELKEDRYEST